MIYVIGSGPAGASCAAALLSQGLEVTILDAGFQLEPERRDIVGTLSQMRADQWDPELLQQIRKEIPVDPKAMPEKYAYGSDFAYRRVEQLIPTSQSGVRLRGSLARGGFSNIWGASVLPYSADDISSWPISVEDLAPHYQEVLSWMDLSAVSDDLAAIFPLYSDCCRPLRLSTQALSLLNDLNRHKTTLNADGISFGNSRLAVRAGTDNGDPGCAYCGLCLHGCPYRLIYNSGSTLETLLRKHPNLHYIPNVLAQKLVEQNGEVEIRCQSLGTGELTSFHGTRVYVACGVLPTTKLILESFEAFDRPVSILESQYFLLPLMRYPGSRGVMQEEMHTLAQLFVVIKDPRISPNLIHLQIYTYNDMFAAAVRHKMGALLRPLKLLAKGALERMLLIQGYLHSSSSPRIRATLSRSTKHTPSVLELEFQPGEVATQAAIKKVVRKLWKHSSRFKALAIRPLMHVAAPGASTHSGGSLPMRAVPGHLQTDRLGRPTGFKRVHVVDASVFPEIPATTVTLTVMANAHRIGSAYDQT